jgi:hypothetical protein
LLRRFTPRNDSSHQANYENNGEVVSEADSFSRGEMAIIFDDRHVVNPILCGD